MRATVESTSQIVEINGIKARVWVGKTEGGVEFEMLVPRVAARQGQDLSEFERELEEQPMPHVSQAFPLRLVL